MAWSGVGTLTESTDEELVSLSERPGDLGGLLPDRSVVVKLERVDPTHAHTHTHTT
jgi:hypothetical protein